MKMPSAIPQVTQTAAVAKKAKGSPFTLYSFSQSGGMTAAAANLERRGQSV